MKTLVGTLLLLGICGAASVRAQTSAFTYQGKLSDAGNPANGQYDLSFSLFDAQAAGNQLGSTVALENVTVSNGIFTVTLDFGSSPFTGGAGKYLEIGVRPGVSVDPFILLSPRQPITSSPYAVSTIHAQMADSALDAQKLGGVNADQYVQTNDSRLSDARAPQAGSANYIQNGTGVQPLSNFNISGTGTVGGQLNANRVNSASYFSIGNNPVLIADNSNSTYVGLAAGANDTSFFNTFVGQGAGAASTTGNSNAFFGHQAGQHNGGGQLNSYFGNDAGYNAIGTQNAYFGAASGVQTNGSANAFFGYSAGSGTLTGSGNVFIGFEAGSDTTTGSGNTFVGNGAGLGTSDGSNNTLIGHFAFAATGLVNATALGYRAIVTQSNSLVLGGFAGSNGPVANTNVGIGTSAPNFRLHLRVDGQDGIKLQHTGTGAFPQIRWTDASDVYKASIGVGPIGSEGMTFTVNGADRFIISNNGLLRSTGGLFISNPNTVIITSPNGFCWGITVSDTGTLATFSTPCP